MNAIPPCQPTEAADRTTRHLRMCAELADLAMQLARAAAARTLENWAEPAAAAPSPTPDTQADPEAPPHATPTRRTQAPTTAASPRQTDPAVLFTRFAAVVRDCIALENRLTAGGTATAAPRAATLQLRADPRRATLRETFHSATEKHPDRAALRREFTPRLDEILAADPDQATHPAHIFFNLCDELGFEVDLATIPDEYLLPFADTTDVDDDTTTASDPRATWPP